MKIQYIKPVTDIVSLATNGAVLTDVPFIGGSPETDNWDANSTSFDEEEEGDDFFPSKRSLWDD